MARETQSEMMRNKVAKIRQDFFESLDLVSDVLILGEQDKIWALDKDNDEDLEKRRKFYDTLKTIQEEVKKDLDKAYIYLTNDEYNYYLREMDKIDKFRAWDWFLRGLKSTDYKRFKEWVDCLTDKENNKQNKEEK